MRFCDKLSKIRKNNNLSQELLAEKLGVSRQAVSKWESGLSYPDMDKIITMCNILNCTLEELLDDGVIKGNSNGSKINFNNCLTDLLGFITRTYNMFCSMNLKEKIKCLIEMSILGLLLFVIGMIIFYVISAITYNLLDIIPFDATRYIKIILDNIYIVILLTLSIIIFIHLFKIRYLDYFITIEDNLAKERSIEKDIIKEDKHYIEAKKEKIIIRDPKHSSLKFFNLLSGMIILCFKFFLVMFVIPLILLFVFLIFTAVISLYHSIYGSIFFFITLTLLGLILIAYVLIKFIYDFIFNRNQNLKRIFILSMIGLISTGIFSGLAFTSFLKYDYIDNLDDYEMVKKIETIDIKDNTSLSFIYNENVNYIIDNSLDKAKIEITYPEIMNYTIDHNNYNNEVDEYYVSIYNNLSFFEMYNIIIEDLRNKKIRNYDPYNIMDINVYLSKKDYDILKGNQ